MFNIDLNTILAQLINFLVLAGLLYFLLFKNAIKRGKEQRDKSLRESQELEQNVLASEKLKHELEVEYQKIDEKARTIIEQEREKFKGEANHIIIKAQLDADKLDRKSTRLNSSHT
jgi:F-type H+-transporting ATPase subunit b